MRTHVILLRGVMPTGKNRVPMAELRDVLASAGFENVRTYIASGNVVADSPLAEAAVAQKVQNLIRRHIGPELGVVVRSGADLATVLKKNPFPQGKQNQVLVTFFVDPIPGDFMDGVSTPGEEKVITGKREVYIHYPDGAGRSKLKLPKIAKAGTARNINTITRLIEMSEETVVQKVCSRRHTYTGSGACPVCWPGRLKKRP